MVTFWVFLKKESSDMIVFLGGVENLFPGECYLRYGYFEEEGAADLRAD